jgi:uncharacterized membrane protein YkoI
MLILSALLLAALSAVAFAGTDPPKTKPMPDANQTRLAKQAKVTKEQARRVALKRAPGTVESGELEREHGKLVYSFDIRNDRGTITEVQVSVKNGRVVRVEEENARAEAAEKTKEKRERSRGRHP